MPQTPEIPVPIGRISQVSQLRSVYKWDLDFVRGDSLEVVFRLFRELDECGSGHLPQTLTGFSAVARIRPAVDYPMFIEIDATVDTSAGSGRVTVSATNEDTSIFYDFGLFELQIYDGSIYKTIVQGDLHMTRDLIVG